MTRNSIENLSTRMGVVPDNSQHIKGMSFLWWPAQSLCPGVQTPSSNLNSKYYPVLPNHQIGFASRRNVSENLIAPLKKIGTDDKLVQCTGDRGWEMNCWWLGKTSIVGDIRTFRGAIFPAPFSMHAAQGLNTYGTYSPNSHSSSIIDLLCASIKPTYTEILEQRIELLETVNAVLTRELELPEER